MENFEEYFVITDIKVKEEYGTIGIMHIKLICKKRRFINTALFYRFTKNLAEKMIYDNGGKGNYSVGWASPDCKYVEVNVYLPLTDWHKKLAKE
ncbi:hypothetical protein KQI42_20120 [Tissierella sp. MSJ-40]|uniref:Uncharacterized protein n=1 Tax=Tissierella simiarum TaxID=2841534 RepID=A0ABS6ECX0_9FIRM|nr:hypothetical protein [Tissierella simiarum]MBU5440305.1 hypothetical protein [Tissierella simiarum]